MSNNQSGIKQNESSSTLGTEQRQHVGLEKTFFQLHLGAIR